jgi:hypothetical protein
MKQKIVSSQKTQFPWLTTDHVRLWKANYNYSRQEKVIDLLKYHSIGGSGTVILPNSSDPDIIENTGVDFPGSQFEVYIDKSFKEVDATSNSISHYDLIIVELADENGQFIFRYNKNPGVQGKCESCYTYGSMRVVCGCKKVQYCNEKCRKKDEIYHLSNCDVQSEVDYKSIDYVVQDGARQGIVGLNNIGNTCYMNSAI